MYLITEPLNNWVINTQEEIFTDIVAAINTEYVVIDNLNITLPDAKTTPFLSAIGIKQMTNHTLVTDNSSETLALSGEDYDTILVPAGYKTIFILVSTLGRRFWARLPSTSVGSVVASSSNLGDLYGRIKVDQLPLTTLALLEQFSTDIADLKDDVLALQNP